MTSPFGPLMLIVNPRAGRGSLERALPSIQDLLRAEDVEFSVARTQAPGHARDLARDAIGEGCRFVVEAASRMPRALGGRAYRLAAMKGVLTYRPQKAHLRMNGRKARGTRIDAPLGECTHAGTVTLVAVANCQFFGGGLRVAPRAIP